MSGKTIKYTQLLEDDVDYKMFTQVILKKPWLATEVERIKKIQIIPSNTGFATNSDVKGFEVNLL